MLLIHGDQFDETVKESPLLDRIGVASYEMVQVINRGYNRLRSTMGYPYWSLAGYFKNNLTRAAMYIERFESAAIQEARRQGVDGLVCGHIHKPNIKEVDGILYCNDGDWVDSCSALVEHPNGRLTERYSRVTWNERSSPVAFQERIVGYTHHQRLQDQSLGVNNRASTRSFSRRRLHRDSINHLNRADKQCISRYYLQALLSLCELVIYSIREDAGPGYPPGSAVYNDNHNVTS